MFRMKKIYMDYSGTTPTDSQVVEAMLPFFSGTFGNPSSLHYHGQEAANALEKSRKTIADALGVSSNEIIFTSGGTESDNLAIKGVAFANMDKGKHIITSSIEHHAVINTCKWLEKQGFEVTYLPVDKYGLVRKSDLENAIRKDTTLVSVIYASNEIGTIQDIKGLSRICKRHGVYFHTDAVQAFGKIKLDMKNVDLLSLSAHKLYGPRGVGALFVRNGTKIEPILHGGGQEAGLRSGTENVAGIVGFAKAVKLFANDEKEMARQTKLRDKLISEVLKMDNVLLNGHPVRRLPNNANFSFRFIEGESLVIMLNDAGISASTGSACSSKSLEPSHVLLAIGLSPEDAHGSLRITIGKGTSTENIYYLLEVLPLIVARLRKISPFKKGW